MGLCPGLYQKNQPWEDRIFIAEDSFWFLELGIKKHCARYTGDAHYGDTAVSRAEWLMILADWEQMRADLDAASITTDLAILRQVWKEARRLFAKDFRRNRVKLSKMIRELTDWIRTELLSHEQISILGI